MHLAFKCKLFSTPNDKQQQKIPEWPSEVVPDSSRKPSDVPIQTWSCLQIGLQEPEEHT